MPKINLKPCQLRNLMVTILLSVIVAFPLFSQPLGLSQLWEAASAGKVIETASPEKVQTVTLAPLESMDVVDLAFNRSLNENIISISQTAPDILDGEDEIGEYEYNEDEDLGEEFTGLPEYDFSLDGEFSGSGDQTDLTDPTDPTDLTESGVPAETAAPTETSLPTETTAPTEITAPAETTAPAYIAADYILYISASQLNLRAEPSTESQVLAELKFGDKVSCIGQNPEWMRITFKSQTGYVKTEYTSRSMVFKDVSQAVYVKSSKLNLRKEPSTSSAIITTLSYMTKLTRTGTADGWSRVRTSSGKTGYVASEYLTTKAPATAVKTSGTAPVNSSGNRIVDLAYSALGVRYVSGSSDMSGFDCSGLTSWIYRQVGITIPRSTSGYYTIGVGVSLSNIQPGDILCMDTRRRDRRTSITHVGIYIGGGNMIHASSTNRKVVLQNVNQYLSWGVKLITVRRIPN